MKTVAVKTSGGYHEAERIRVAFARNDYDGSVDFGLTALKVTWDDRYRLIGHRDVLGSLMGLGIDRAVLGDILMQGAGCQIVADSSMAEWIKRNFLKVAMVSVQIKEISLEELEPPKRQPERCGPRSLRFGWMRSARQDLAFPAAKWYNA